MAEEVQLGKADMRTIRTREDLTIFLSPCPKGSVISIRSGDVLLKRVESSTPRIQISWRDIFSTGFRTVDKPIVLPIIDPEMRFSPGFRTADKPTARPIIDPEMRFSPGFRTATKPFAPSVVILPISVSFEAPGYLPNQYDLGDGTFGDRTCISIPTDDFLDFTGL